MDVLAVQNVILIAVRRVAVNKILHGATFYRILAGMIDANDLEDIRKALKFSRAQFAEYLGVDAATVWRWRQGKMPEGPTLLLLERLKAEMIADKTRDPWSLL